MFVCTQCGTHVRYCRTATGAAAGDNADLFSADEAQVIPTPVKAPQHRIIEYPFQFVQTREVPVGPWGTHKPWASDVNTNASVLE